MTGGVFDPQGPIASQERGVILAALGIMLLIAIPLLVTLYIIAWKYRAGRRAQDGQPQQEAKPHPAWKELIWWAIPSAAIIAISIMNWKTTHALDPAKSLSAAAGVQPLTIQVVALQWKWLFLYPAQGIATVNEVEFPAGVPIHFELTADGPMSSFWIPQLGSQMYAMEAMETQLNLMADATGSFMGKDTEINGAGYAGMNFTARAVSQQDFDAWSAGVRAATSTGAALTADAYRALAMPSENNPVAQYSSFDPSLYAAILAKDSIMQP